jgi:acetyl esterase/lipase
MNIRLILRSIAVALLCVAIATISYAQQTSFPLWSNTAPGAQGNSPEDIPTLTPYLADKSSATGTAVVVCPGGSYQMLAEHEGRPVAQWLNTIGVTAFVLKYRLGPRYHHPVELGDAQRAIRTVRSRAREWGIDPNRIGILGFSAGGHLASTAATHFDSGDANARDAIDRASSRPDFAILVYPVITMGEFAHQGSKNNLLGPNPSPQLVDLLSNEKQVTRDTPPTFLVHTADDTVVPVENSLMFASALRRSGVPFELHVFEHGPHGFGLAPNDPVLARWTQLCAAWLAKHGWAKQM